MKRNFEPEYRDTRHLKVGDKVYIRSGNYEANYHAREVKKVTPTGMVDVEWGAGRVERFRDDGSLKSGDKYSSTSIDLYLSFDDRTAYIKRESRLQSAANAVNVVTERFRNEGSMRAQWGTVSMAQRLNKLQVLIDAARLTIEDVDGGTADPTC